MNHAELRRLAIRLAMTTQGWDGECPVACRACMHSGPSTALRHREDCPIAELEAEEAASVKLSIGGVDIETVPVPAWKAEATIASGDDWSVELIGKWRPISMELKDGTSAVGYVRMVPAPTKPEGEFEGEY